MAAIPAVINVDFTSNYAGDHRVCWRIGNTGPYDCSTVVTCTGGATPCSANIGTTVDNETCDDVTFEGYVQAICEDILSLNGRVAFSTTFTPDPTCDSYTITCESVGIDSFVVVTPGSAFIPAAPPALVVTGDGTLGAGNVVIGDGGFLTWTITNGGTLYDGGGSATFLNQAATTLTGIGTGATFDVTVTLGVITSVVLSSAATSPGSGYAIGDTVEFGPLGGTGSGSVITVDTVNTGQIQYVQITNSGGGYTTAPTVTVSPGNGSIVSIVAIMDPCEALAGYLDCDGGVKQTVDSVTLGSSFNVCFGATPTLPTGYSLLEDGCCYDCTSITVDKDISDTDNTDFYYTDCATLDLVKVVLVPGDNFVYCAVTDSWLIEELGDGTTTVTPGLACP